MDSASYLNRILEKMSVTHDIVRDYHAVGRPVGKIPQKSAKNGLPDRNILLNSKKDRNPAGVSLDHAFPAYAYYASTSEKYILTKKANLWSFSEYEHVLFLCGPEKGGAGEFVDYAKRLISDYMEPVFVRKEEKYPPRNHMRSFLTLVLVFEVSPDAETVRKIRKYRYDKGYLFSIRGYAQGRLIAVDLPAGKVYTSPAAKDAAAFFAQNLS